MMNAKASDLEKAGHDLSTVQISVRMPSHLKDEYCEEKCISVSQSLAHVDIMEQLVMYVDEDVYRKRIGDPHALRPEACHCY